MKQLFDLCPTQLKDRLKKVRKEKLWQPPNDEAIIQVDKKLKDLKLNPVVNTSQTSVTSTSSIGTPSKSNDHASNNTELLNTWTKEDLQAQNEILKDLENKCKDIGPVFDCIVWNDGGTWWACVDTSEKGELESATVLTNYKDSHKYATFSYTDMLNYTVRILHEDNILQIVTDSSTHGTHVASIAAGYYENNPELNGVAPGAQIVSIKVGDNRINAMETGYSLANACRDVIENKCDLVNYSFGEPVAFCHAGSVLTMVEDLSKKYGGRITKV